MLVVEGVFAAVTQRNDVVDDEAEWVWHAAVAVGSCAALAVFAGDGGERVVDELAAQCAGWLPSGDGFAVPVADGGVAAWGGPGVHRGPPPG